MEQALLQPLWDFLANPITPFYFIGFICFLFLWGLADTYISTGKVLKAFKKAFKVIASKKEPKTGEARKTDELQKEFYENFDIHSKELQSIGCINELWEEYQETLIIPAPSSMSLDSQTQRQTRQIIYLTSRPQQYFSLEYVLGARRNLSQLYAFPNYLIGFGLLFTFLGLAAAIAVAQHDLTSASGGTEGLQKLLRVASTKFITSVVAIFLSLLLSILQRYLLNRVRKQIHDFCIALERRTEFLSPEKLLHSSLAIQEEQKFYIANLADNITLKFETILNTALPKSVSEAMSPLVDSLKKLAERDHSNNEGALKSVLEEFLRQMHKGTGEGMSQLANNIQTLVNNVNQLVAKMENFGGNFGQEMGAATQKMADTMDRFVTDFSGVQRALIQFTEVLESLKIIADNIKHAGSQIQGAADGNIESAGNLNKTHGELAATVQGLSGNLEPLKDVIGQMAGALDRLLATSGQLNDAGNLIKGAADDFSRSSNKLDDVHAKIGGHMLEFKQVADGMQGNIKDLVNASGMMAKAATPVEQLSRQMMDAVGTIHKSQDVILGAFNSMSGASDSLKQITSRIESSWGSYQTRFEKVDKDLENAFNVLAKGTDEFQHKVKDFITSFDGSFNDAIQALSSAVNELAEEREEKMQQARIA